MLTPTHCQTCGLALTMMKVNSQVSVSVCVCCDIHDCDGRPCAHRRVPAAQAEHPHDTSGTQEAS